MHAGPKAAVGKAVVSFGAANMVKELALGDVTYKTDVRGGCVQESTSVVDAQITAIPGATKQRRELSGFAAEEMEDGGELLCEQKETAVGGRLLIAQSLEDGARGGAAGGDAAGCPESVDFVEEIGDLTPACSFSSFAGFADEDDVEIEAVAGGADEAMWGGSGEVAEGGEELQQQGHRVGFTVRGKATDDAACQAMEGWIVQHWRREGGNRWSLVYARPRPG